MERRKWSLIVICYLMMRLRLRLRFVFLFLYTITITTITSENGVCNAIESPQYKVVHSESDVEIRLYPQSFWLSALVPAATSFQNSTQDGFHRVYQYIHGANLNSSELAITSPVLTSINQSAAHESDYSVRFYLSAKYKGAPPLPNPELDLLIDKWRSHCVAVRKFSGFAKDDNINKEMKALVVSLGKILTERAASIEDKNSYTIAQYNASFHLSGRLNEVWINVSGFTADGCPSY
ncbi:uncharacterized protein LOC132302221 [Cornus florida]|uniref:uncharacterized protein LOC132302221 n=1 Tax=Cornus florida TaxID=4283 RepID=UPI00289E419C|nr:uncharacterized protein LOC132302221 [Cornus florida]